MNSKQMEYGQLGVELMTAKTADDESLDLFTERLHALVDEHWNDGMNGRTGLLKASLGLVNVATVLVALLSETTGNSKEEILQEVARHFQPQALEPCCPGMAVDKPTSNSSAACRSLTCVDVPVNASDRALSTGLG